MLYFYFLSVQHILKFPLRLLLWLRDHITLSCLVSQCLEIFMVFFSFWCLIWFHWGQRIHSVWFHFFKFVMCFSMAQDMVCLPVHWFLLVFSPFCFWAHSLSFWISAIMFFSSGMSIWSLFINSIYFMKPFNFNFSFVSSIFVMAYWSIFVMCD